MEQKQIESMIKQLLSEKKYLEENLYKVNILLKELKSKTF